MPRTIGAILALTVLPVCLVASQISTTWTANGGDWNVPANWDCNCIPNNGGGLTYAVSIASGSPTLGTTPANPSIDSLSNAGALFVDGGNTGNTLTVLGDVGNPGMLFLQNGGALSAGGGFTSTTGSAYLGEYLDSGTNQLNIAGPLTLGDASDQGRIFVGGYGNTGSNTLTSASTNLAGPNSSVFIGGSGGSAASSMTTGTFSMSGDGSGVYVGGSQNSGTSSVTTGAFGMSGNSSRVFLGGSGNSAPTSMTTGAFGMSGNSDGLWVGGSGTSGNVLNTGPFTMSGNSGMVFVGSGDTGVDSLNTNGGAFQMTGSGNYLFVGGNTGTGSVTTGALSVAQGSYLFVGGSWNQGDTLTTGAVTNNGFLDVGGSGTSARLDAGANPFDNYGTVVLGGNNDTNDTLISGPFTEESGGNLYIGGNGDTGDSFSPSSFVNAGNTVVDGTLNSPAAIDFSGGTVVVGGTVDAPVIDFSGGTVSGTGTLSGNVVFSDGTITPGDAPGPLYVNGDYTQTGGTLDLQLMNLSTYGQLLISGSATLGGTLEVDLLNSYVPNLGDQFTLLTYLSETGQFSAVDLPSVQGGQWVLAYQPNDLTLTFESESTPEPGTLLLMICGALAVLGRRRIGFRS